MDVKVKEWLGYAQDDLKAADILYKERSYRACAYHCHQTMEKILKAAILARGHTFRKIHDLVQLYEETRLSLPKDLVTFLDNLNPHHLVSKYPEIGYKFKYNKRAVGCVLKTTIEAFKWLRRELS